SEQQRIVSILDTFTSSISNLKQQIEERRKQYEYERDLLLDLEGKEGVEMKKLGECVLFITDGDHQPPPKSSEGIPFVTISDIEKLSHTIDFSNTFFVPQEYYNSLKSDKKAKKGDVLYTVTGSFGIPVLIEDNREFCFQRHIALIRPNNTIALSRYIYHWLCSNYAKKQGEEKASGGAQKTVSLNSLRSFHFYYPSLQAQSRIVSILDTFEQSIANLEEQLAMREKQYEYYREKLLRFEEA
ncbi:MAG: restriction endonuclease subunit S, partial [Bacteroidaceae bacterium]|nr:restriction endonuclease subunit S [Bacteroidaceae bacterium]